MLLRRLTIPAICLAFTACVDTVSPVTDPPSATARDVAYATVPPRGSDLAHGWHHRPDSALWRGGGESGQRFAVGLKEPGSPRGVWRDRVLISERTWTSTLRMLSATPGLTLLSADTILPNVLVHLASPSVLSYVRGLPFVDYVEPSRPFAPANRGGASGAVQPLFSGGGGSGSGSGCSDQAAYDHLYGTTTEGDAISWSYASRWNDVVGAWRRSQGDGIRIALLDTGVDAYQPQLTSRFSIAPSGSRTIWHEYTSAGSGPAWRDDCGHGTRMAGLIAAPLDGQSVVGIAYMADLISIRVGASVMPSQEALYAAIHMAMDPLRPAHIVVMGVATDDDREQITDAIRYYWYRTDAAGRRNGPIFIAAAGTNSAMLYPNWNVVYPAELPEVTAVSAVDSTWTFDPDAHYGPEVDLSGFRPIATVGTPGIHAGSADVTRISGSSSATGSVAAIAALVWARYPWMTNVQLRDHLYHNASRYPYRTDKDGYGTLHAYKAVGGFVGAGISGPNSTAAFSTETYTAWTVGDGPFAYRWSNGATTQSTTYTVGEQGVWITLEVTDLYENRVREARHRVDVSDGGWTWGCDPNLDPTCPA